MFGIVLICVLIGDLCLVMMDDDEDVVCIEAPVPPNARTPRQEGPVARNGGAVRVRFNGESSEGLTVSMCCRKNGRLSAAIRLATARYLTQKIFNLIFTSELANSWN